MFGSTKKLQMHPSAVRRPGIGRFAALCLLSVLLGLSACSTSMRQIPFDAEGTVAASVAVGDTVRVLTKDGDRQTFKVTDITMTTLIGEDIEIAFSDIEVLEKRYAGATGKTTTTALLAIAAGALIVVGLSKVPPGFPPGY